MAGLYLWNPTLLPKSNRALTLFITRGDTTGIAEGTQEFAQQILETLGVRVRAKGWEVTPYRSKYFSEYLGEKDWRDNWQLIWKMRIETTEPLTGTPKAESSGIGTDAFDNSFNPLNRMRDDATVRCLVVADFSNAKARDAAAEAVEELASANDERDQRFRTPEFSHAKLSNGVEQLQIDLGPFPASFYSKGAKLAEEVITVCKKAGATVHFQERPKKDRG